MSDLFPNLTITRTAEISPLKIFTTMQLREALAHAAEGGQAIHLHMMIGPKAPACFKAAVNRGEAIAHLFDGDKVRLTRLAKWCGVRVVFIDKAGTPRQHIDLCGKPLRKLLDYHAAQKKGGLR